LTDETFVFKILGINPSRSTIRSFEPELAL
jgi:hypothetical protein